MVSTRRFFLWLRESGVVSELPTLYLAPSALGDWFVHSYFYCFPQRVPSDAVTIDDVEALAAVDAPACPQCGARVVGGNDHPDFQPVSQALTALRLIENAQDMSRVPYADVLPALAAERLHQVLDHVARLLIAERFGPIDGPLAVGVSEALAAAAATQPRQDHSVVLNESTRLAAVFNAARNEVRFFGPFREVALRRMVAGCEPSEVLEGVPDNELEAVSALLDDVENRIAESRMVFTLIGNYPSTFYAPSRSLLETAVIASARYHGRHRVIGEIPTEVQSYYPPRPGKDNRAPFPQRLTTEWEPVENEVFETALALWDQSSVDCVWKDLSSALQTAIQLG